MGADPRGLGCGGCRWPVHTQAQRRTVAGAQREITRARNGLPQTMQRTKRQVGGLPHLRQRARHPGQRHLRLFPQRTRCPHRGSWSSRPAGHDHAGQITGMSVQGGQRCIAGCVLGTHGQHRHGQRTLRTLTCMPDRGGTRASPDSVARSLSTGLDPAGNLSLKACGSAPRRKDRSNVK